MKGLHKVSRRYRCAACHSLHFLKLTNYRAIVFTFSHLSRDKLTNYRAIIFKFSHLSRDKMTNYRAIIQSYRAII